VNDGEMSASLTIAASDWAGLRSTGDPRQELSQFARDSVHVSVDDKVITPAIDRVFLNELEARVVLLFGDRLSRDRIRRLSITSDVAKRLSRGHRQHVVLSKDARVMHETLLDSSSGPVTIALESASTSAARALWLVMIAIAGATFLIRHCRTEPYKD
jgi:hypothetical protein